jgi:hypothetical protein
VGSLGFTKQDFQGKRFRVLSNGILFIIITIILFLETSENPRELYFLQDYVHMKLLAVGCPEGQTI